LPFTLLTSIFGMHMYISVYLSADTNRSGGTSNLLWHLLIKGKNNHMSIIIVCFLLSTLKNVFLLLFVHDLTKLIIVTMYLIS
jgi:hypothetical protein